MVEQVTPIKLKAHAPEPGEDQTRDALVDLELNLLLDGILRLSGLDFRDYAQATLKRRVAERVRAEGVASISGLQERVLHDPQAFARFALAMSGGGGHPFRDPAFFALFRERVIPLLRTYSYVRIWVPNCSSGEDAYSLATILHEEGILSRTMIYSTDFSELAIAAAKSASFPVDSIENVKSAHHATGSTAPLSNVAEIGDNRLTFREEVRKNLIFAQHSLVSDGSINEFHAIVARGVLPQFNKALQYNVHNLFLNSLVRLGFLCLGTAESLKGTPHERIFRELAESEPIYRRMR